ncbi:MAG: adenine phosphoribosyltransferase [Caldilineales bacterium]|nr:adenine phosphoribosyltransferase [Caldilineales bacterium]
MTNPDLLTPYSVTLAGVERQLPRIEIAPGVIIAILNILGDTELSEAVAKELAARIPKEAEVLITPEAKSIPFCYALSVHSGIPYVVLRKTCKPYMTGAVGAEVISITTGKPQTLWLDGRDIERVAGKQCIFVDDVISTGSTLRGTEELLNKVGGILAASVAILVEGDEDAWPDVITLGRLPVWFVKD